MTAAAVAVIALVSGLVPLAGAPAGSAQVVSSWGQPQPLSLAQPHSHPDAPGVSAQLHAASTTATSKNWAGLVESGSQYTAISADWTVPTVQASAASEASATWIGIDGYTNSSLIQTGTAQDTANGRTSYYAWYEILPSAAIEIGAVSPGDRMAASIGQVSAGTWSITMDDLTSGQHASGTLAYGGPGSSAEWVEEAPTSGTTGNIVTLADFGTAQFSAMATGTTPVSTAALTAVSMTDSSNIIAYPGTFDAASASFPVTYGAPTTISPTPSGSSTPPIPPTPTGSTTPTASTPPAPPTTPASPSAATTGAGPTCSQTLASGSVVGMAATRDGGGYWIADRRGRVADCGDAADLGQVTYPLSTPVVAIAATSDGGGFWMVTAAGQVLPFGDAGNHGSITVALNKPIVALADDPATGGYWLLGADGGVFSFDAPFYGSTGGLRLTKPAVGMVATADGSGYYFVASDGGVFAYDAAFRGSMGAVALDAPVVGMALDAATGGYWLDAADGGIFSFAAPFEGSTGGVRLAAPCVSMSAYPAGSGYRFVAADGGVFDFNAPFEGSAA